MKQIEARTRPRIPAISGVSGGARLDRHLAVLSGPAMPVSKTEEAAGLLRDLTARTSERAERPRTAGISLFAPLRRLRRTLFGGRR